MYDCGSVTFCHRFTTFFIIIFSMSVVLKLSAFLLQTKILKKSHLEYWRQEFKGITTKDIVGRIINNFRPESEDDSDVELDLKKDLIGQDSDDEEEPLVYSPQLEIDEDSEFTGSARDLETESRCSCLPKSVKYAYEESLPAYWPDPKAEDYQAFFRSFFLGQARDAQTHNWQEELNMCKSVQLSRLPETSFEMSIWQAAGYLHAKKVVSSPSIRGTMFYWTPGSGKSILVALLLEVLYATEYKIFVVSSTQNIAQNDLDSCAKSLLKFSPIFNLGGREPTEDDVKEMRRLLRRRPNGPPVFKMNFMTFRQFGNYCKANGPEKVLEKAALIIDESHLMFDDKKCDVEYMWGTVLETLTRCADSKVFTFSGTPGKSKVEILLQLELVRSASTRIDPSLLLEETEGWEERLSNYARGLVSYVDGTKDISRYPINFGLDKVLCDMSLPHLANFSERCNKQLRNLDAQDIEEMLAPIREGSGQAWKEAVRSARLIQTAANVFSGGCNHGLRSAAQSSLGPTMETLAQYSQKFATLIKCILCPPDTEPLETKHFIYSSNMSTITTLAETLESLKAEGEEEFPLFKQLTAEDFEWSSSDELELRLASPCGPDHPRQILYVVLHGLVAEKKKLKSAFGQMTPDGRRYEGLKRADGSPLIQILLGSQESNQGLTFLRLQHIHLMEPNPKGWSEVRYYIMHF
jgi:hypothetical protein